MSKGRVPFELLPDDLIRAASRGDTVAVQAFLDDGFSPNAENDAGYTALMAAARSASLEVIRLILSRGGQAALVDRRGYTALHWAVAQTPYNPSSQVACVRALIDAGADLNAANEEGITSLMNAAWFGCRDSVQELLRRGADPLMRDRQNRTARDLASERGHREVEELLRR